MTSRLERAAVALAAKLHECRELKRPPSFRAELAALEAALAVAPIDRELIDDLPRMIELEKHSSPETEYNDGWNAALDTAAQLARFVLARATERN